jgi:hypothetical protein
MTSEITTPETTVPETESETEAKQPAKKRAPRKPKAPKTTGKTLADLCEAYVAHLEEAGKSPGTVFSYTAELKLACSELGRDTQITALTPEQVQVYYDCDRVTKLRSGAPKANASVAKTRRVLRLALCHALEQGWIEKVPLPASDAAF